MPGPRWDRLARLRTWRTDGIASALFLVAERPSRFRTRFGNRILRGEAETVFEEIDGGTRLVEIFEIQGFVANIAARIFGMGSYKGSFQGELNHFKAIAEREWSDDRGDPPDTH